MFKFVDGGQNFVEMEKKWLKLWYENGVVTRYLKKNSKSSRYFSFQDGPITANNPMGVHHAWGRTYKDLWQKFNNLLGKKERFQNGFDCQGLWVEVEVEKELGIRNKKEIENLIPGNKEASIAKFVDLCKARVYKYSAIQTEQSKRLGYFMDWEHSYYTMSDENNYMIWHFLKKCYENGWIYKGRESVPWCPRCETAISQHEMLTEDYKQVVHESIYLEFKVEGKDQYLLVWTTTPWTIPANIAVAVDENLDYALVEGKTGYLFWIAKDLVESVFKKEYKKIVKTVKGKELVGLKYKGPFDEIPAVAEVAKKNPKTFHTVIPTDEKILPISTAEGTGLVHTAVSAGTEDFQLGKKLGLPMIAVIADNADYLPGLGFLAGKNAKKHPELIFDYLKSREEKKGENWIFEISRYKHRYPACWRCKTELVWKVADEWYIAMDKTRNPKPETRNKSKTQNLKHKTLREMMIEVAKKIKWMPSFGLDRELDWLKNMNDWLISKKNRYWGLTLPIYECQKCGNFEVIGSKQELKKRAVSGWDEFEGHTPHKPFIDKVVIACSKCKAQAHRVNDVGNPWLDAGIVPYSTIRENNQGEPLYLKNKEEWKKWFPVDFITESFPGQFKNWFYAMIAMSTVLEDINPFKAVLGFGTMLDEKGRPFHKSAGNAIEFVEGADRFGADIIRWVCCSENPANNILFGENKTKEVMRQFYLMLWNVYKYFVEYANLDKFKVKSEKLKIDKTQKQNILDLWIINSLYTLAQSVKGNLGKYNAKDSALEIEKFVTDLSTWYVRRSRDRVWVNSEDKDDKNSFYSTLHFVLVNLSIVLSSFVPFISEEIFTNLATTDEESVHLSFWPDFSDKPVDTKIITDMQLVRDIAEVGHRVRKELKFKVRQPLASATITVKTKMPFLHEQYLKNYEELIQSELNVKKVIWKTVPEQDELAVEYDVNLTDELKKEGELRELIRKIQAERKKMGARPDEKIELIIPHGFKDKSDFIKKRVLAEKLILGDHVNLKRI